MPSDAEKELISYALREPVLRTAFASLGLPPDSRGLDAGCGVGGPTLWLAQSVGPQGRVIGLDASAPKLALARETAVAQSLASRVSFEQGEVQALPFGDDSFDWAISVDCLCYGPAGCLAPLQELTRVVRGGGLVAVLFWSSQTLLPGHPRLEARLNATIPGLAPFAAYGPPSSHPLRSLGAFAQAGLGQAQARTFVGQAQAPLSPAQRQAMTSLLEMRWPGAEAELAREDSEQFQSLCTPGSGEFILDQPGYYAFFTYTMIQGEVPG